MTTFDTHTVYNQSPPFDGVNLFTSDRALMGSVDAEGGSWGRADLEALGGELGSAAAYHQGHLANKHRPELVTFDPSGYRHDQVEFHPAYHHFMALSKVNRIHCGAFDGLATDDRAKGHGVGVVRAAKHYMVSQVEAGHVCPITMTHAAIPALMVQDDIAAAWLPKLLSASYDPAFKPFHAKLGVTIGMGMTEKQGGTDVRANASTAVPRQGAGPGKPYLITGHKWFMSAPMCDAFLVLAQADGGLSVFLVPRFKENDEVNSLRFQRLKNKLGNQSNASSEVEFAGAEGYLLGEEGRGIANIMTMANYTRLDCALGSSGQMRQALLRAYHHSKHRTVFQKKLIDQPMMTNLMADMVIESEAATCLSMRLAGAYEAAGTSGGGENAFARLMTPVIKYWVTKRAPTFVYEAMECLGGNGYVEDGMLARLYRDVPVNSIWEGTGSVMCLDLLRVLAREKGAAEGVAAWLEGTRGSSDIYDRALDTLLGHLSGPHVAERRGRWLCEQLATLSAACLLMERAPFVIAEAYLQSRIAPDGRSGSYGTLPDGIDMRAIVEASLLF